MPFGLATAPATFMRLMTRVSSGMLYTTCFAYIDDIIVFGRNYIKRLGRIDSPRTPWTSNFEIETVSAL
jgi:hypothetical protein